MIDSFADTQEIEWPSEVVIAFAEPQNVARRAQGSDGGTVVSGTAIVKSFTQQEYTCGTDVTFDAVEVTSTGGTALRYDASSQQFIQNWKTPTGKNKCYKVTVTLTDDQTIQALFKTK